MHKPSGKEHDLILIIQIAAAANVRKIT